MGELSRAVGELSGELVHKIDHAAHKIPFDALILQQLKAIGERVEELY